MKTTIYLIFFLILTGCSGFKPCPQALFEIHNSQYIFPENCCATKSVNYCNHLLIAGFDAQVVVGNVQGYDQPHAWVKITEKEKIYYVDPTFGMKCSESKNWRNRKIQYIFNKNCSAIQVLTYQNCEKIS